MKKRLLIIPILTASAFFMLSSYEAKAQYVSGISFDTDPLQYDSVYVRPMRNPDTCKISFILDGTLIKTQFVKRGDAAASPGLPDGYTLESWNKSIDRVTSDLTVDANYWYDNKYYEGGILQTGLRKIGNSWYLLDKETGDLRQSGDKIRIGTFYNNEAQELTRFYLTLNGYDFEYVPSMGEVAGKHMNFIDIDGTFYGLKTIFRNRLRAENPLFNDTDGKWFDVGIRETTDFVDYTWHYFFDSYVEGNSLYRFSPEWFLEDDRKYVFYSVDAAFDDIDIDDHGIINYTIFRTEITDLVNNRSTTPEEMSFDVFPELEPGDTKGGLSHPCVVKDGDRYMMFAQDNHSNQADQSRGEAIWVYSSADMKNWSLEYKISKDVLPQNEALRTDEYGNYDLDEKGDYRWFYRYYTSPYVMKIGDTWHFYADEITLGTTYRTDAEDMYSGKIVHLVSKDISDSDSWENAGYINVGENRVRSGSIMTVRDNTSETVIRGLYNEQ